MGLVMDTINSSKVVNCDPMDFNCTINPSKDYSCYSNLGLGNYIANFNPMDFNCTINPSKVNSCYSNLGLGNFIEDNPDHFDYYCYNHLGLILGVEIYYVRNSKLCLRKLKFLYDHHDNNHIFQISYNYFRSREIFP